MARYDQGVKFDYPSRNDGFVSHVARRGAEKTATGAVWFVGFVVLIAVIALLKALAHGSQGAWIFVGIVVAYILFAAVRQNAVSAGQRKKFVAKCPGCATELRCAAERGKCFKCGAMVTFVSRNPGGPTSPQLPIHPKPDVSEDLSAAGGAVQPTVSHEREPQDVVLRCPSCQYANVGRPRRCIKCAANL